MKIALVRHGQASAHRADYDQLSEKGFEQARALGAAWRAEGREIARIVRGPRRRHRETAEGLLETFGDAPEVEVDDALDEHQGVMLTRLLFDDLVAREDDLGALARDARDLKGGIQSFLPLFRRVMRHWSQGELDHPDVEPYRLFRARVEACVAGLTAEREGWVVAVTSGGPVGAAVAGALGLDDARAVDLSFVVQNASVSELQGRERPGLFRFNGVGHLLPALRTFV